MSGVPFTRTLPYVLREQLRHEGVTLMVAKVAAVPDSKRVTIDQAGVQITIPRLSGYAPTVNEPVYCLAAGSLIIALGTVK